ncbi:hypothetical protein MBRA1_003607 [Malassezia brasiliensis]|uniref:PUM-HD domain-containing protein n=1 Tax=Malassezia brasiliensis TaxID=1821822 RepID=A0AAF0DXV1_9BASI|nr:hypothetical protein MBRA1_003607 [Malassezia brasiliensis]
MDHPTDPTGAAHPAALSPDPAAAHTAAAAAAAALQPDGAGPGAPPGAAAAPGRGAARPSLGAAPGAPIGPAFNERFLFDDELETADDSTFLRKYNLSADDDDFPVLRQEHFPSTLSTFSSALDLAPLSHMSPRQHRMQPLAGHAASLSPWLHAAPNDFARGLDKSVSDLTASTDALSVRDSGAFAGGGMAPTLPGVAAPFPAPGAELFDQGLGAAPGTYGNLGLRPNAAAPGVAFPRARPTSMHDVSALGGVPMLGGALGAPPAASPARSPLPDAGDARSFARYARKESGGAPAARTKPARAPDGAPAADDAFKGVRRSDVDLATMRLEDLHGELSQLCRDQYGCRFLQKKLEENVPAQCDLIFRETFPYFAELMTDPFGNYLCQKLLEYCTDAQRDQIVDAIAPDLVTISLNMHGTRAVQKTIDFLSTPAQTQTIIAALRRNVVTLIKDLNGNHVIQKCLNRLAPEDSQFIYDAVAQKCVDVATHRHGCCVMQRCIDHATDAQRLQLVNEITCHALPLVQDPFGNYVVQYVLDLNDPPFNEAVTQQFLQHVCVLSAQKFSSNVIEKCIRVAEPASRKLLIDELIDEARLESLLRDSFANYVVQTALDYAEPAQRAQLVNCIRPILPAIRNTPYGKRIQSKLQRDAPDAPLAARGPPGAPARGGAARGHARHAPAGARGGANGARPRRKHDAPALGSANAYDAAALGGLPLYAPLRPVALGGAPGAASEVPPGAGGGARAAPKTPW